MTRLALPQEPEIWEESISIKVIEQMRGTELLRRLRVVLLGETSGAR